MSDAIKRRMESKPENHTAILESGIEALYHPDVPSHVKMAAAPVLFAAKHFGSKGMEAPSHLFEVNEDSEAPNE